MSAPPVPLLAHTPAKCSGGSRGGGGGGIDFNSVSDKMLKGVCANLNPTKSRHRLL